MRIPLIYALHCSNLNGTERMALATVEGLLDAFEPIIFAPPGPVHDETKRLGFQTQAFLNKLDFVIKLHPYLAKNTRLALMATGIVHSLALLGLNLFYRRKVTHLQVIHGGSDERGGYGRKKILNHTPVRFVAVSNFSKSRLIAHGVRPDRITVIENFLTDRRRAEIPQRPPFDHPGIRNVIIISRTDPIKRIDLLLDALDYAPTLSSLSFQIYGTGELFDVLRTRAEKKNTNVRFMGFNPNVTLELHAYDLLLHLCPEEGFCLTVLEAMAAGVPILGPDKGGAGEQIEDGVTGFRFKSNDVSDLAKRLRELMTAPPDLLNSVVANARRFLDGPLSAASKIEQYRKLLTEGLE